MTREEFDQVIRANWPSDKGGMQLRSTVVDALFNRRMKLNRMGSAKAVKSAQLASLENSVRTNTRPDQPLIDALSEELESIAQDLCRN